MASNAPVDLAWEMAALEHHHAEGQRLHQQRLLQGQEWAEHQALIYAAMVLLGMDGLQRLGSGLVASAAEVELPA